MLMAAGAVDVQCLASVAYFYKHLHPAATRLADG
jgi:hypothetical protein